MQLYGVHTHTFTYAPWMNSPPYCKSKHQESSDLPGMKIALAMADQIGGEKQAGRAPVLRIVVEQESIVGPVWSRNCATWGIISNIQWYSCNIISEQNIIQTLPCWLIGIWGQPPWQPGMLQPIDLKHLKITIHNYVNQNDAKSDWSPFPSTTYSHFHWRAGCPFLSSQRFCCPQVDYVNTHGTSTPIGDVQELGAVKRVFEADGGAMGGGATQWECAPFFLRSTRF